MLSSMNNLPVESRGFNPSRVFLDGPNPFGLSTPPAWFLEALWTFDPLLVIFRSQEEAVYRLCRRVEHTPPIMTALRGTNKDGSVRPDSAMLVNHRLVPVTSILPSPMVAWSPVLLADLAERDVRRIGGYRRAADRLDQFDESAEDRWRRTMQDDAGNLARFSYRTMKWQRGETVDLGGRKSHGARTGAKPRRFLPAVRPRLSEGSYGAIFTGRTEPLQESTPYVEADSGEARVVLGAA